jgi:hypothetical protein
VKNNKREGSFRWFIWGICIELFSKAFPLWTRQVIILHDSQNKFKCQRASLSQNTCLINYIVERATFSLPKRISRPTIYSRWLISCESRDVKKNTRTRERAFSCYAQKRKKNIKDTTKKSLIPATHLRVLVWNFINEFVKERKREREKLSFTRREGLILGGFEENVARECCVVENPHFIHLCAPILRNCRWLNDSVWRSERLDD